MRGLEAIIHELLPEVDIDKLLSRQVARISTPRQQTSEPQSPVTQQPLKRTQSSEYPEIPEDDVPDDAIYGFDWNEEDIDALNDGMAALSVDPSNKGYFGVASSAVIVRALRKPSQDRDMDESVYTNASDSRSNSKTLPDLDSTVSLTAKYLTNEFIDSYFENYHSSYPFIHKETFLAQYRDEIPIPNNDIWQILLNAVLALGAWCLHGESSNFDLHYYQNAKSYLSSYVFESGSIPLLLALTLLSNYAQKRNKPNTGWNYLGLAVRMAMGLGLYKEFANWSSSKQQLQLEMRRRIWWGLYIFDGGAAITFGRPVNLPDAQMMDINEVSNIDDDDQIMMGSNNKELRVVEYPTIYSGLIWQARFTIISTEIYNRLISTPRPGTHECLAMNDRITKFVSELPKYFSEDKSIAESASQIPGENGVPEWLAFTRYRLIWRYKNLQLILMRAFVLQRVVGVQNPAMLELAKSPEGKQCRVICMDVTHETILSVAEFVENHKVTVITSWYATFFLFHASLVSVVCLRSDPKSKHAVGWKSDIILAKQVLRCLARDNSLANKFITVIDSMCGQYLGEQSADDNNQANCGASGASFSGDTSLPRPSNGDGKIKVESDILPDVDFTDIALNAGINELWGLLPSDIASIETPTNVANWPQQAVNVNTSLMEMGTPAAPNLQNTQMTSNTNVYANMSDEIPPRPAPLFTHNAADFSRTMNSTVNSSINSRTGTPAAHHHQDQDFYSLFMTDADHMDAKPPTDMWNH